VRGASNRTAYRRIVLVLLLVDLELPVKFPPLRMIIACVCKASSPRVKLGCHVICEDGYEKKGNEDKEWIVASWGLRADKAIRSEF
jgi:hypothetical protein